MAALYHTILITYYYGNFSSESIEFIYSNFNSILPMKRFIYNSTGFAFCLLLINIALF